MADIERTYNVPLRKGVRKAPKYKRASKAVIVLRKFLVRHMKSNEIKIGPYLNSKILEHGRKNVAHHIEVKAVKDKDGIVRAEYTKAKSLDFLKPKEIKEEEVKLKIPGFGKKKEIEEKTKEFSEKEKKEILEHPPKMEKVKMPEIKHKDKEEEIMIKEEQVYGRLGSKKTKVKEKKK